MKKRFSKIISTILILASLVSVLTVFAYAEEDVAPGPFDEPAADVASIELMYNRNFDEGWDYTNGLGTLSNHVSYIDFEETSTYKYNYFWRIEAAATSSTGYSKFDFGTSVARDSGTVVQFKIKADDACDLGRILYMTTGASKTINLLYVNGTALYAFQSGNRNYKLCDLTNEWITVTLCFDWDAEKDLGQGKTDTLFRCRAYIGDEGKYVDYEADYEQSKDKGLKNLYFGIGSSSSVKAGMSYCIDDLQIYQKTKAPVDLSGVEDCGSKVNNLAEKVIDIQEGPGKKSTEEIINEALCMKVGVSTALIRNVKKSIADYCIPVIVDGKVMVPLMLLLDFIGYPYYPHPDGQSYDITTGTSATYITIGRDTATVDGVRVELSVAPGYLKNAEGKDVPVIAAEDIPYIFPGWLLAYDDMGLIVVYQNIETESDEALIHRDTNLDLMLDIMKRFVFDTVTKDESGKDFADVENSYIATGESVFAQALANSEFNHPYLIANQEKFDALKAIYTATENADAKAQSYLSTIIAKADAVYANYAALNSETAEYEGIIEDKKPVNVYSDGDSRIPDTSDGYSNIGTLDAIVTYTDELVMLAFAYQVTGEEKYAELAYDFSLALGEWAHWGPSYAINCATATGNFALAFDWLYNAYFEMNGQEGVDAIATILYEKGVKHGYNAAAGISCEFPRGIGDSSVYNTLVNNWNAACSSGMIIGALALGDYEEYADKLNFLVGNNIIFLIENGLDQYAPDGSYAESALMWADGTNGFVKLIMALESAAGTSFGFKDTWGLDRTFYFACYIEDSDGKIWNFHEGGADGFISGEILGIDTQMFFYAGQMLNDDVLVAIRQNQIEKGKEITIFDMLFYPTDFSAQDVKLELDYHMEGIHAFVSRSDWEEGALYTGIMGGANDVYGGQIDSGNFIYRNEGITWFMDLGSDNQEAYNYFGNARYNHYRNNAEGQNVVALLSALDTMPYGQNTEGSGKITSTFVNDHGSYAILNNTSAYGGITSYANRGLLITNDRKTVVLQDEISFKKTEEAIWIAHTSAEVTIDEKDTRVAYLTAKDANGDVKTLRATIVPIKDNVICEWELLSAEAGEVLEKTYDSDDSVNLGGAAEYSRAGIQRLVIRSGLAPMFNISVVFEMVDSIGSDKPTGYSWVDMARWEPQAEGANTGSNVVVRDIAKKTDIQNQTALMRILINTQKTAYTTNLLDFYHSLTLVAYTLKTFKPDDADFDSNLIESYIEYDGYKEEYEKYMKKINNSVELIGMYAQVAAGIVEN